ncbi:hypothetical protein [Sphingomonas echinoides]|uniref:hypothetical protein n=1 Tax=Sphingomonas echinoides TaxID=59803 RepID=UPI0024137774|nr:hypothetical protein [Sphingomonas echinoides]
MSMLMMTIALMTTPAGATNRGFVDHARMACAAPIGKRPRLAGIQVERSIADPGDLPKLRITDQQSGAWMLAYYDRAGEKAAYARAACLGAQLRLLAVELGEVSAREQWFSSVFTTDGNYVAPPNQTVTRWKIHVEANGSLGNEAQSMIVLTMPHEQVHRFQKRAGSVVPRWLEEGHAEWISRKVRQRLSPEEAQADVRRSQGLFEASKQPLALGSWGGMRVKREAIMRQVPPEERRRMEADPAYTPSLSDRSFSIGPDDVTSDESNLKPRYEGSWRVFRDLEAIHGQAAVQNWMRELTSRPGRVDGGSVTRSATDMLNENLSKRLG